jgi:hypothetical protein
LLAEPGIEAIPAGEYSNPCLKDIHWCLDKR